MKSSFKINTPAKILTIVDKLFNDKFLDFTYLTSKLNICESLLSKTIKNKIDNHPTPEIERNLTILIEHCLDPIREKFGKPITVTSGYRCEKLNELVGGKSNSQHLRGEAADLVGNTNVETKEIFDIAKQLGNYDQLLFETNGKGSKWVHISYKKTGNRKQCIDNYNVK